VSSLRNHVQRPERCLAVEAGDFLTYIWAQTIKGT